MYFNYFFHNAIRNIAQIIQKSFNFVLFNRKKNHIEIEYVQHFKKKFELNFDHNISFDVLSRYIVLTILINIYFSDMHNKFHINTMICVVYDHAEFDSILIYEYFYQKICNYFLKSFCKNLFSIKIQNECIKNCFLEMFAKMQTFNKNVVCIYKTVINNLKMS